MEKQPLDDQYHGRCHSSEKREWERAAAKQGRSLNNWIRQILNEAADQALKPAEKQKGK